MAGVAAACWVTRRKLDMYWISGIVNLLQPRGLRDLLILFGIIILMCLFCSLVAAAWPIWHVLSQRFFNKIFVCMCVTFWYCTSRLQPYMNGNNRVCIIRILTRLPSSLLQLYLMLCSSCQWCWGINPPSPFCGPRERLEFLRRHPWTRYARPPQSAAPIPTFEHFVNDLSTGWLKTRLYFGLWRKQSKVEPMEQLSII